MPGNRVIGKDVVLIGQEVVAEELGVTSQAISNWYARAALSPPESHLRALPVPTMVQYSLGKKPMKVWQRAQLQAWRKWHARHLIEQAVHIPKKQQRV